jgi:hypothetical protein
MAQIGRPLDPWQADIVLDAFGVQDDGLWALFEMMVLLSRQNGKGGVTEAIELGGLFLFHEPLILHSAHQFKTSTAAFRRLIDIIDGSDWLTKRVRQVSRSKGDEGIYLTRRAGGGALQFVARTVSSGRGLTGSKNIFDEAWALTVAQYAAQTPTLATIPNPQIIYTTTPPDDDIGPVPEDAMLPSVRARAMAGDERTAIYEWSPSPEFDRTDRDVWYDCNPAMGIRISEWFLAKQLTAFTAAGKPQKFDTEHLGVWPLDGSDQWDVVDKDTWDAAADLSSVIPDGAGIALAVDADTDRSMGTIGVCGLREDGRRHIEVVDRHRGTGWILDRVVELCGRHKVRAVVILKTSTAASLISGLVKAGLPVYSPSETEYAQACGGFFEALVELDMVRHMDQASMTMAVGGARKRENVEGGWRWSRDSPVDAAPIVCATLSWWGLENFSAPEPMIFI